MIFPSFVAICQYKNALEQVLIIRKNQHKKKFAISFFVIFFSFWYSPQSQYTSFLYINKIYFNKNKYYFYSFSTVSVILVSMNSKIFEYSINQKSPTNLITMIDYLTMFRSRKIIDYKHLFGPLSLAKVIIYKLLKID